MDKNYQAWWMRQQGATWQEIGDKLGVSRTTATRWGNNFDASRAQGFSPDEGPDIDPMAGLPGVQTEFTSMFSGREMGAVDRLSEAFNFTGAGSLPDFNQPFPGMGDSPFDLGLPIPQSTRIVPFGGRSDPFNFGASVFGSPNIQQSRTDPSGRTRNYNVFDSTFGVSLVQNADSPHGGFIPTASFVGGEIIPADQNFQDAFNSNSFIPSLQAQGAPYMNFSEMSPQNLAKASSLISIPGQYWNEKQEALGELRTRYGMTDAVVYGGGSHAFQLGPVLDETFMRTPSGDVLGYYGVKSIQHGGIHETLGFEDAPGSPRALYTSPFQTEDQSSPLQGVLMNRAYSRRNVLFGEGQAAMNPDAGYLVRNQTYTIDAPEGGLPFKAGDVFGFNQHTPRTLQEGDVWRGNTDGIPGLPSLNAGSYHMGRIDNITQMDDGRYQVSVGMRLAAAGNASAKLHEKYNLSSMDLRSLGPEFENVDIAAALPGGKYIPQWARNVASATMSPEEVQQAFGSNVISREQSEMAQDFFVGRAKGLIENAQQVTIPGIRVSGQTYDLFKDQTIGDTPVLGNARAQDDGSYLVDYTDEWVFTQTVNRFRPEQAQYNKLLGREELDRMAESRPEIYANLRAIEQAGGMPNYAREVVQAHNANRGHYIETPRVNADDLDISAIQEQVIAAHGDGLTPREMDIETLREVAKQTKGQMIQMGGFTFASASAAISNVVLDNEGNPIINSASGGMNYASAMAQALRANESYKQTRQLNAPENWDEARSAYNQAIDQAVASQSILAGHESTVNRSLGMTMPMATGAAQQIQGIAENEAVIDQSTLFRLTNARTDEQRSMAIEKLRSGELPITATMYPHANPDQAFAPLRGVLLEDLQKREGMSHIRLDENRVGISSTMAQFFEKDFDADYFAAFTAGRFVDDKWVGDAHSALSAEDIRQRSIQGYAKEFEGIREKAMQAANPDAFWADVNKRTVPVGEGQIVGDYDDTAEAKSRMGQIYNYSVRDQYVAGNIIADNAGIGEGARGQLRESLSRLAKRPYQPALDMDPSADPGLLAMEEMSKFASYDSSKKVGYQQGYIGGPNTRPFLESANPETLGKFTAKMLMSAGMTEEGWETEVAPDIARGLMPMRRADDEDAVGRMVELMKGFRDTGEFDQAGFLDITGRKSMSHWLVGSQNEELGDLSALGAYYAGAYGSRAAEKSANYRATRSGMPGHMGKLSRLVDSVRAGKPLNKKGDPDKLNQVMDALPGIREAASGFQHSVEAIQSIVGSMGNDTEPIDVDSILGQLDSLQDTQNIAAINDPTVSWPKPDYNNMPAPPLEDTQILEPLTPQQLLSRVERGQAISDFTDSQQVQIHQQAIANNRQGSQPAAAGGGKSGGGAPNIPGGPPGGGGGGDSEPIPGNTGGGIVQHIGDRIESQTITEANIKTPFMSHESVAEARESLELMKQFRGELGKLNEIQGPLTQSQEKYRDALIKLSGTLEKHTQNFEIREDLIGRGLIKGNSADAAFKAFVAEDPEFWAVRDEMEDDVGIASRKKFHQQFMEIAREGGRVPQPTAGELFSLLGGGSTKRGRADLNRAWDEGRFDDWLGGDGEGLSRAGNRMAARLATPLANASNFLQDPGRLSGMMWRAGLISSTLLYPSLQAGSDYQGSVAERDLSIFRSGQGDYDQLMDGEFGRIQRTSAMRGEAHLNFGRSIYNSYGFAFDAVGPGSNAIGAGLGIAAPALGVGALSASVLAPLGMGPVGWGIGAATLGAGALSYAHNAGQNYAAMGQFSNELRSAGQSGDLGQVLSRAFNNPAGLVGHMVMGTRSTLGGMFSLSEEEKAKYEGAPAFDRLVDEYSRGIIGRETLEMDLQNEASGFSVSQGVSAALNKYIERESAQGISREVSLANYTTYSRFNPNEMMPEMIARQMRQINLSGANLDRAAVSFAGAMGINPLDPSRMGAVTDDMIFTLSDQANPALYEERLSAMGGMVSQRNQAARLVGGQQVDPRGLLGSRYETDVDYSAFSLANQTQSFQMAHANSEFYNDGGHAFFEETERLLSAGQLGLGVKRMGNIASDVDIYNNLTAYGGDSRAIASNVNRLSGMTGRSRRQALNMIGGDPTTLSQNWEQLGDIRYNLIDPETGLGAYEENISRAEYDALAAIDQRQTGFGRNRLGSFEMVQGGERDMRLQIRNIQRDQMEYGFAMTNLQTAASWQLQVGGATGVNPISGFAGQGDGLRGLQGMMRQAGMDFNRGNGMGMWQIQDAQTALSREQQIWNMQQQGLGVDRQERNFELQDRQFYEKWNMNKEQFEYGARFQRSQMQRSRRLQVQSEDWREEDMAFDRSQTEIQTGWQMEDYDRNLRYARGRDRLDMMRSRDRSVLMNSMNMAQRDRQEDRFETTREDSRESYNISRQDQARTTRMRREELDMQKRHYEERRGLEREALDQTKESFEKQKQWLAERMKLEDQERLIQRQWQIAQQQWTVEMNTRSQAAQIAINQLNDSLSYLNESTRNGTAYISSYTSQIQRLNSAVGGSSTAQSSTPVQSSNRGLSTPSGNMTLTSRSEQLLQQIADYGPARLNATINTRGNQTVNQLVNRAYRTTRTMN